MVEQMQRLWNSLGLRQKLTIAAAVAAVAGSLAYLVHWNKERSFQVLYSGMASEDAATVVAKLKETGVEYRLSADGSAVRVPEGSVPDVRLQMAAAGLPKSGRIGFELFDKANLGVSEFAEQINYQRAIEGELERSVTSLAEVERARVHVTPARDSVFLDNRRPAKASVLVKLRPNTSLTPQNVLAIQHLTASAVDGLSADQVAVMDVRGSLLSKPRRGSLLNDEALSDGALEYRRSVEKDLLAKIHTTLEPLLGPDKFRAGVTVECDFSSGEQNEEIYDPARSVMLTSQRTEDLSGGALPSGVPGVASNLPRPTSRPASGAQGVTRRTENISYQSSRTVRRVTLPQGTVKRLSVSVLVDHLVRFEGTGAQAKRLVEPLPPERLKVTRDLVAAAIGLTPDRGDQLIVESLPFESTLGWETEQIPAGKPESGVKQGTPAWLAELLSGKNMMLLGAGAGAVLLLAVVAVILARRLRGRRVTAAIEGKTALPPGTAAAAEEAQSYKDRLQQEIANQAAIKDRQEKELMNSLKLPPVSTKKADVLAKHLVEEAKKDPAVVTQLIRTWINENE